jgi:hypothetical protein
MSEESNSSKFELYVPLFKKKKIDKNKDFDYDHEVSRKSREKVSYETKLSILWHYYVNKSDKKTAALVNRVSPTVVSRLVKSATENPGIVQEIL